MASFHTNSVQDLSVARGSEPRPNQDKEVPAYEAPQLFALGTMGELVQGSTGPDLDARFRFLR
jgi:hypothetical protein